MRWSAGLERSGFRNVINAGGYEDMRRDQPR